MRTGSQPGFPQLPLAAPARLRTLVPQAPKNDMKKTSRIALLSAPLLLAAALPSALALQKGGEPIPAQEPADKDAVLVLQTQMREIAEGFYTVRWPKGKTVSFLVGEEGVLLIDTHLEQEIYNIEDSIAKVTDKPVTHLINTHWHADHTSSNAHWGKNATIIAHENAKLRMEASPKIDGRKAKPPMTGDALPDVTFKDKMELEFGGHKLELIHLYGGHTDGDIIVWIPDLGVCVTGDVFYSHEYPFVDTSAGGDPFQLLEVGDKLNELLPEEVMLIPGHGAPVKKEALTEYRAMLEGTMLKVQDAIDRGINVNGMMAEGLFDEYKERWDESGNKARGWAFTLFTALKPQ